MNAAGGATGVVIREADLRDPAESRALVEIIDCYAREPGGQSAPLSAHARRARTGAARSSRGVCAARVE